MKSIYIYLGTTAELIRFAPVIEKLNKEKIKFKLIITGQNKINLDVLPQLTGKLTAFAEFTQKNNKSSRLIFLKWFIKSLCESFIFLKKQAKISNKKNMIVMIYGDPISTIIGSISAKIIGIKVIHLESGDFSFNIFEPFPEEICRYINAFLADVLFPPSGWAMNNLKLFNKPKIDTKYNLIAEGVLAGYTKSKKNLSGITKNKYYVLIFHRQEHVYFNKEWSKKVLMDVIQNAPSSLTCVLFNHPLTVDLIQSLPIKKLIDKQKIIILPLIGYSEFLSLIKNAEFLATDGATNQFETYMLGTPCLLLRNHTEQIEGLNENVLLFENNRPKMLNFLKNYKSFRRSKINLQYSPSKIVVNYLKSIM